MIFEMLNCLYVTEICFLSLYTVQQIHAKVEDKMYLCLGKWTVLIFSFWFKSFLDENGKYFITTFAFQLVCVINPYNFMSHLLVLYTRLPLDTAINYVRAQGVLLVIGVVKRVLNRVMPSEQQLQQGEFVKVQESLLELSRYIGDPVNQSICQPAQKVLPDELLVAEYPVEERKQQPMPSQPQPETTAQRPEARTLQRNIEPRMVQSVSIKQAPPRNDQIPPNAFKKPTSLPTAEQAEQKLKTDSHRSSLDWDQPSSTRKNDSQRSSEVPFLDRSRSMHSMLSMLEELDDTSQKNSYTKPESKPDNRPPRPQYQLNRVIETQQADPDIDEMFRKLRYSQQRLSNMKNSTDVPRKY